MIRFGIPSDGALHKDTIEFLFNCGLEIRRSNPRSYTGEIINNPEVIVHFQRARDITLMIENESIDIGIVVFFSCSLFVKKTEKSSSPETATIVPLPPFR